MTKLLSVAVPCYNSAPYMSTCIDSLLPGGEDVEILIIDDGSTDSTAQIAADYQEKYPSIVKVIHQKNGGHGAAVNTGIANARGIYFKVVDSDDRVEREPYGNILRLLGDFVRDGEMPDMMVSNFIYDKVGAKHKKVMQYRHMFPKNRIFTWDEAGHFPKGHYILMHSVIFRTEMLRESGLKLPEHTFYVDNMYVFEPLPFVKTLYYLDETFYSYYIGREDQSVNENVMISRIDQQIRVNRLMIDYFVANESSFTHSKKLYQYMYNYLEIMMTISSALSLRSRQKENLQKKNDLWAYLKSADENLYRRMRHGFLGSAMNLPGRAGRRISEWGYCISRKIFKFN